MAGSARHIRLSEPSIRTLIHNGELKPSPVGSFLLERADLDRKLTTQKRTIGPYWLGCMEAVDLEQMRNVFGRESLESSRLVLSKRPVCTTAAEDDFPEMGRVFVLVPTENMHGLIKALMTLPAGNEYSMFLGFQFKTANNRHWSICSELSAEADHALDPAFRAVTLDQETATLRGVLAGQIPNEEIRELVHTLDEVIHSGNDERAVQQRIKNLCNYLASLQEE